MLRDTDLCVGSDWYIVSLVTGPSQGSLPGGVLRVGSVYDEKGWLLCVGDRSRPWGFSSPQRSK